MPTELVVQSDEQAAKMQESTQLANTWTVQDLVDSAQKVKEAMAQAMSADVHYGVIPGTRGKPSLWKPGAEKLCSLFRLGTQIELNRTELDNGHLEVEARVRLVHLPTGRHVGEGWEAARRWKAVIGLGAGRVTERSVSGSRTATRGTCGTLS